jgi:NADH-quinone oxidoreductase subunit J
MVFIHNYLSILLLYIAFEVINEKNSPIINALSLISCFFVVGSLLFFFDADFLALTFIIVYVGGVAVLFLFVIMMMDVKVSLDQSEHPSISFGVMFLIDFFFWLIIGLIDFFKKELEFEEFFEKESLVLFNSLNNIDTLGQTFFNNYTVCFLLAGFVLLVALIGAVFLTLDFNQNLQKMQLNFRQLSRSDKALSFAIFIK